jgi:hypothetical protein
MPHDILKFWRSSQPSSNLTRALDTARWNAELLSALEWKRFEDVCTGLFGRLGFRTRSAKRGPDGGVDIWLQAGAALSPQCGDWKCKTMNTLHQYEIS